ncbi:MAG: GNAT family N-acetyltransferase [Lachnospiraceae bacterium]|nr:GNAT family N-acetyltransferase [Lachnospiraceae bacterium]
MVVRRIRDTDIAELAKVIKETLIVSNGPDYPESEIQELIDFYAPENIRESIKTIHLYVVCDGERIVGCGGIENMPDRKSESILVTIFVLPEYQGKGIGKQIIETLEQDDIFLQSERVEIHSSITARLFYEKMGYAYENGITTPNEEGCIHFEKCRSLGDRK